MVFRELKDLPQADWLMLYMQSMSLLPCIYIAGLRSLEIPAACFSFSKTFHLPQLHLYRSATGVFYMLFAQQQNVLNTHGTVSP